jgi:hypothetical protein
MLFLEETKYKRKLLFKWLDRQDGEGFLYSVTYTPSRGKFKDEETTLYYV